MINSVNNEQIKKILKLNQKKEREISQQYLIYGIHLIEEAAKNNVLDIIITDDIKLVDNSIFDDIKLIEVHPNILKKFDSLKKISIVGVCKYQTKNIQELNNSKVLGINKINNPGNLGTILRTAKAFGINDVILDTGTVDIYNFKTIQAAQGVNFSMNIYQENLLKYSQKTDKQIITTFLNEKNDFSTDNIYQMETNNTKLNKTAGKLDNYILIFGNEAQGIEEEYHKLPHLNYKLEIEYESLNVAIACGIIIYNLTKGEKCVKN